ncbi:MAG: peptidoglycan DD-metalloendopeptidase family protein [Bacteroidales bacterium]|nr:peptidoglycan DD-metalloendopeptidase family protein [Bacteroidales bacterium]
MARKFLNILFVFVGLSSLLLYSGCHKKPAEIVDEVSVAPLPPEGFRTNEYDIMEEKVRPGEAFTSLMVRLGMTSDDAMSLAGLCDTVFDVRKMRAGNSVSAYYTVDSTTFYPEAEVTLKYVVYKRDKTRGTVFKTSDSLAVWNFSRPVDTFRKYADVTITSSLWNDMTAAGAPTSLIVALSEIYAWSVDFFALQEGDRFKILYDESVCDGEIVSVDPIYYAEFERGENVVPAILYDQGDGGNRYWKEDGSSLRKAFLKAPLKFTRISSGFSYHRKHPVSGKVKAHTAVDYAAPTGTPVMSIGDGTVLSAGWTNGGGNTVKIRHNATYTTSYMHLSRYASGIKAGTHVRQGDVIGYVGATGVATGPHLDFRVWKNGTPVNPLTLDSPSEEPIKPENLAALDSTHVYYKHIIDSLIVR